MCLRNAGSALLGLAALFASPPANAAGLFCTEPRAPSTGMLIQPGKPYCSMVGKGCSQYEIDSYKRQITAYFDELRSYLEDVDAYRKKAYSYAECMAELN